MRRSGRLVLLELEGRADSVPGMTWEATLLPVLLSAVVSAVVALVVSLGSAGVVVKVQGRAERSVEARRELRELVTPIRRTVAQYRADSRAGRVSDTGNAEDAALAARVLSVSEHLPRLRRWSIRRRVRRLVGPAWFELAELLEPGDEREAFDAWFVAQMAAVRAERRGSTSTARTI